MADARSLFANADAVLYRAKHEGRGLFGSSRRQWISNYATGARWKRERRVNYFWNTSRNDTGMAKSLDLKRSCAGITPNEASHRPLSLCPLLRRAI